MMQSQPVQMQPVATQPAQMQQVLQQQPLRTFNPDDDKLLNEIVHHQMVNSYAVNLIAGQDCCCFYLCAYCDCKDALNYLDRGDGSNFMLKAENFNKKVDTSKTICAWCQVGRTAIHCACCLLG